MYSRCYKVCISAAFFTLCAFSLKGQIKISGTVDDTTGRPISSAVIILTSNSSSSVLAYALTNEQGKFIINLTNSVVPSGYKVSASLLGYIPTEFNLEEGRQHYDFKLRKKAISLPQVNIKGKRFLVAARGDTLSYNSDSFSGRSDRVIGDVLKKIPGIDVSRDGRILYNGQAVKRFYLDDDDLMGDKYGVITNNVPSAVVDKIQILENHQPIKMFENKVFSDDIDLRITLKGKARLKVFANGHIGLGIPHNFDGSITGFSFKNRYKAINYVKANNVGNDFAEELGGKNDEDLKKETETDRYHDLLSSSPVNSPAISKERYVFNKTALASLNNLIKLDGEKTIKFNFSVLANAERQNYLSASRYYLPSDTIRFEEDQTNALKNRTLKAELAFSENSSKHYFNDNIKTSFAQNNSSASLFQNGIPRKETLNTGSINLSNDFQSIYSIRKNSFLEIHSSLIYLNNPQQLGIDSSLAEVYLVPGATKAELIRQTCRIPSFFSNSSATVHLASKLLLHEYKVGVNYQAQVLLSTLDGGGKQADLHLLSDSVRNNLVLNKFKPYLAAHYQLSLEKLRVTGGLSLNWLNLNYRDRALMNGSTMSKVYLNSSLTAKYNSGLEDYIQAVFGQDHSFGSIGELFPRYILTNYRSLTLNEGPLEESVRTHLSLNYFFRRIAKILFINLGASYSLTTFNKLSRSVETPSLEVRSNIPYVNDLNTYKLSLGISKYLSTIHTTSSINASLSNTASIQFQNRQAFNVSTVNNVLGCSLVTKASDVLSASIRISYNQFISTLKTGMTDLKNQTQSAELENRFDATWFFNKHGSVTFSGDQYHFKQPQSSFRATTFLDLSLSYYLKKFTVDGLITNLLNQQSFVQSSLSATQLTSTNYLIRGRMAMVRVGINLNSK